MVLVFASILRLDDSPSPLDDSQPAMVVLRLLRHVPLLRTQGLHSNEPPVGLRLWSKEAELARSVQTTRRPARVNIPPTRHREESVKLVQQLGVRVKCGSVDLRGSVTQTPRPTEASVPRSRRSLEVVDNQSAVGLESIRLAREMNSSSKTESVSFRLKKVSWE